jgi:hypothetical protein
MASLFTTKLSKMKRVLRPAECRSSTVRPDKRGIRREVLVRDRRRGYIRKRGNTRFLFGFSTSCGGIYAEGLRSWGLCGHYGYPLCSRLRVVDLWSEAGFVLPPKYLLPEETPVATINPLSTSFGSLCKLPEMVGRIWRLNCSEGGLGIAQLLPPCTGLQSFRHISCCTGVTRE